MIPSPAQTLLLLALVVVAFLGGLALGALDDPSETPAPEVVEVEVPTGDFENVPLTMTAGNAGTWHYTCDMHFTPDGDTAECELTQ